MKKAAWGRVVAVICAGIIFGSGCASLMEPQAEVTATGGADIGEATLQPYNGPKARITIAKFDVKAAKAYGTVGDGMADMLGTALFQSNRYVVLERSSLSHVLAEQDLSASSRVRKDTATKTGEIEGAELLVIGTITEFDPGNAGVSAGAGLSPLCFLGGIWSAAICTGISAIAGSIQSSHVAIDLRIVDAKTSRVVAATSVEGKATDIAALGSIGGPVLGGNLSGYAKTPMEKAIRTAIRAGVQFIVGKTPAQYYRFGESGPSANNLPDTAMVRTIPTHTQMPSSPPPLDPPRITVLSIKPQFANMRAEPSTSGKIIAVLKRGSLLSVLDKSNEWYRVRTESGGEGFVAASVTSTQP